MEEEISNTQGDISNKTIVVLVILTVLISVLGTFTVLSAISNVNLQSLHTQPTSGSTMGKVSVTILGPGEKASTESLNSAGYVTLGIIPK